MANLSQIKLPNGTTYDIKDSISGYTTNTGTITQVKTTAGAHTTIDVSNGAATFNVPTKTSHLTNDSDFATFSDIQYADDILTGTEFSVSSPNASTKRIFFGTTDVHPYFDLVAGTNISLSHSGDVITITNSATIPSITLNGTATTSPSFYAPTTVGTNGYVLKSNGSGVPTWTSATLTDEKVKTTALTSGTLYYPILATGADTATRQIDSTLNGLTYKSTAGTTSAIGTAQLTIGNSTASGTANNEQGQIILYGSTAYAHTIVGTPTAARTITLPDATGTLALNTVVVAGASPTSGGLMSQADKTKLDGMTGGVIVSATEPTGVNNHIWVDTTNNNIAKFWDGTNWTPVGSVWS